MPTLDIDIWLDQNLDESTFRNGRTLAVDESRSERRINLNTIFEADISEAKLVTIANNLKDSQEALNAI